MPRSTPDCRLPNARAAYLSSRLGEMHVYGDEAAAPPFRLAPSPHPLPPQLAHRLDEIGEDLLAFQGAVEALYRRSEKTPEIEFVRAYLDRGKGETLLRHSQLRRLRRERPVLIRPDILLTERGLKITEIDTVPGGFGTLAALQEVYSDVGFPPLGGGRGVLEGFHAAMASLAGRSDPTVAITVSDESADYRPEMALLAALAKDDPGHVATVHPRDVAFRDGALFLPGGERIDVLYRFFELFDIRNVPKWELFLYAAKHRQVVLTPPAKPFLEEKLQAALLFLDELDAPLSEVLGRERLGRLRALFPETWVIDGRDVPPFAQISGLRIAGRPVRSFQALKGISQAERQRWVLKPSGFSPLAWGSHGVHIGEDLSLADWDAAVDRALEAWAQGESPWILQRYTKPVVTRAEALDDDTAHPYEARGRYSPYYFVHDEGTHLAGVLVTLCPKDKKIIHGMTDAVMAPGALV